MTNTLTVTVLGRSCANDSFPHKVTAHIRDLAAVAEEALGGPYDSVFAHRHLAALKELGDYVLTLGLNDPRLWALWTLQGALGGNSDEFNPGPNQVTFLSAVGGSPETPSAADLFNELVAVGTEDGFAALREGAKTISQGAVEEVRGRLSESEEREREAQEEIIELKGSRDDALDEIGKLEERIDYLRRLLPTGEPPKKVRKAASNGKPKAPAKRGNRDKTEKAK